MKPLHFITAQFFLLSLSFAVLFDPIGISYFLIGTVWILNHKLSYVEGLIIFVLKGQFGWSLTSPAFLPLFHAPPLALEIIGTILIFYIPLAYIAGAFLAINMSGTLVLKQIRKKAPDILGMISA